MFRTNPRGYGNPILAKLDAALAAGVITQEQYDTAKSAIGSVRSEAELEAYIDQFDRLMAQRQDTLFSDPQACAQKREEISALSNKEYLRGLNHFAHVQMQNLRDALEWVTGKTDTMPEPTLDLCPVTVLNMHPDGYITEIPFWIPKSTKMLTPEVLIGSGQSWQAYVNPNTLQNLDLSWRHTQPNAVNANVNTVLVNSNEGANAVNVTNWSAQNEGIEGTGTDDHYAVYTIGGVAGGLLGGLIGYQQETSATITAVMGAVLGLGGAYFFVEKKRKDASKLLEANQVNGNYAG